MHRTLILCRHAYRDEQEDGRFNPPLSRYGAAQSLLLANRLKEIAIDRFYVSPYLRTIQTANTIRDKLGLQYHLSLALGEWLNKEWMTGFPELSSPFASNEGIMEGEQMECLCPCEYRFPETTEDLDSRCRRLAKALMRFEGTSLLVTHGVVLVGVCAEITGKPKGFFNDEVSCLTILACSDGKWDVIENGSVSHINRFIQPFNDMVER